MGLKTGSPDSHMCVQTCHHSSLSAAAWLLKLLPLVGQITDYNFRKNGCNHTTNLRLITLCLMIKTCAMMEHSPIKTYNEKQAFI